KQKVKRTYLMTEKQFRKFFDEARKSTGNTGTRFLQLLEMRLDNVVYRMGLAKTRNQARQFVTHGHVRINGRKMDIPSYVVNVKDEVSMKPKMAKTAAYKHVLEEVKLEKRQVPDWLTKAATSGQVLSEPLRENIDKGIKEQFIIELYSK
ncbi:MAG: 30S ribosomal protein S4, partial [candidate division WS6 bacterium GW2011_GWA2_37_6]